MVLFSKMLDIFENIFLKLLGSYYSYINAITMFRKSFSLMIFRKFNLLKISRYTVCGLLGRNLFCNSSPDFPEQQLSFFGRHR